MGKNEPISCDCISGKSLLNTFNNQEGCIGKCLTLEEHIDIAIEMAMKEAAEKQVLACADAIKECELVEPNVNRIRLYEAIGACISAGLYQGSVVK